MSDRPGGFDDWDVAELDDLDGTVDAPADQPGAQDLDEPFGDDAGPAQRRSYAPFVPGEGFQAEALREARQADPFLSDPDEDDEAAGPGLRPPPAGMKRRDRREWRLLETARLHRLAAADRRDPEQAWRGGFMRPAPGWLNRKSRKAWLVAERADTRRWWQQQRGSTGMAAQERAAGVLVVAGVIAVVVIVIAGGLVIKRLVSHHDSAPAAAQATSSTSTQPAAAVSPVATAPAPVAAAFPSPTPSASTDSSRPGPAGPPGRAGGSALLGSGWQPIPPGGVAAVQPSTGGGLRIDPAQVRPVPAPSTAPSAKELSSPTGAVLAWLARTCPADWRQPYGAAAALARTGMTAAAWTADTVALDAENRTWWNTEVVPDKQVRVCGELTATLSDGHQASPTFARVVFTADKVMTAPGRAVQAWRVAGVRQVLRQPDGRWLVDTAAVGG